MQPMNQKNAQSCSNSQKNSDNQNATDRTSAKKNQESCQSQPEMRPCLVAGNWKMMGSRPWVRGWINEFLLEINAQTQSWGVQWIVFPPFVYLELAHQGLSESVVGLGAQDVATVSEEGAYTGEVSASMLADVGCRYVLVGHSERRQYQGERDEVLALKLQTVLKAGLTPILCVGESAAEKQLGQTESKIKKQLEVVFGLPDNRAALHQVVIAYEPIWAIGTGVVATAQEAQKVHAFIRSNLLQWNAEAGKRVPLLYGGSVKANNVAELIAMPDIDGVLVGGASLDVAQFLQIGRLCNPYS